MIERRRSVLLISLLCAICLFASTIGFFFSHGDITYRLWSQLRCHDSLALHEVTLDAEQTYTFAQLIQQSNTVSSSHLMLINHSHPIPIEFEAEIEEYNGAKMHPDMIAPYVALRDEIQRQTGMRIYVSADFRTPEEQAEILEESEDGIAAQVGCSEHEAGLALDVYAPYFGGESLLKSPAGRLLGEICADYGFVVRYPLGKEEITGISYEPWHLRYVGTPHARIMTDAGLTLEEYIGLLTPYAWYESNGYLISRQFPTSITLPTDFSSCVFSLDNTGCIILTVKP